MSEIDEIVSEFLVESHENLDQLDRDLVALEKQPDSRDLVASIFRTIHTIKGTSGFLAFHHLEAVTHVGENLLARIRDGKLSLTPARTSVLLDMVDAVRGLLAEIESSGTEGSPDHVSLVERLKLALEDTPDPVTAVEVAAVEVAAAEVTPAVEEPAEIAEVVEVAAESAAPKRRSRARAKVAVPAEASADEPVVESSIEPSPEPVQDAEEIAVAAALSAPDARGDLGPEDEGKLRIGEILVRHGVAERDDVHLALYEQELHGNSGSAEDHPSAPVPAAASNDDSPRRSVADSTLRVDVDLLDSLMRLVGELVLTRNQVVAHASGLGDPNLLRATQRLNLIASELQEGVMKTRMQPIDNVWNKLPRVVRDLGVQCGRQVRLVMEGRETELDKTILEAIKDPLTHLVRNAIDHGIEDPAVRISSGKPAEGTLSLRAFHEGGQVNIEIRDDGAGIDPSIISAKAIAKGLISPDAASRMNQRDILKLVFEPGFSTREEVSNVSGRGVGMDVVKTNIENIGGTVDLVSEKGTGTTFRIKIPLTLAIIPTVTIECGGERFAIPQINLVELVSLDGSPDSQGIEHISDSPVYRLRGKLLPLVFLSDTLGVPAKQPDADGNLVQYIVVLHADGQQFGLVVDAVLNTEEIVVKPLSSQLKRIALYAGATILGDGKVALILDVLALAQASAVLSPERHRDNGNDEANVHDSDSESFLVVRLGSDRRVGIPLAAVTRLEEFGTDLIERAGNREVVQYRGHILPLIRLGELFGVHDFDEATRIQVVVHTKGTRSVGIVVGEILDITDQEILVKGDRDSSGLSQSAVVQDKITELLDVANAMALVDPSYDSDNSYEYQEA